MYSMIVPLDLLLSNGDEGNERNDMLSCCSLALADSVLLK